MWRKGLRAGPIVLSTRRAGLTRLSHEAAELLSSSGPGFWALSSTFGRSPSPQPCHSSPSGPQGCSCSYNQRRPFCVHLRGAWLWSKTPSGL